MYADGERVILHCDCNCFFASVEMVAHPEYRTVPMAVCGSAEERHGIVLAKNDLAKKCGVTTGEAIWQAMKKCPALVVAKPHYNLYEEFSHEVNRIYSEYTDMIEPFGIDESWLDVTASRSLFGNGRTIADEIRGRIRSELGITASAGVSFNKTFAKLGSDYRKPDATTVITRESYRSILYPLPIGDMMYVGHHTVPRMRMLGINTIGDLACADEDMIISQFGKTGKALYDVCNGRDYSEVSVGHAAAKSYGNGMTFMKDLDCEDDYLTAAAYLADKATARMRADNARCRTVSVFVRDTKLSGIVRQKKLREPTASSATVYEEAVKLLRASWNFRTPARSIQVACNDIIADSGYEQLRFESTREELLESRRESLDRQIDKVRAKYGKGIITRAGMLGSPLWKQA